MADGRVLELLLKQACEENAGLGAALEVVIQDYLDDVIAEAYERGHRDGLAT